MQLQVNGHSTFCYTGGKAFDPAKPTVVFIHGVLHDHSVWILQSRYLAHHGWNVLAVDLPGHGVLADRPFTIEAASGLVRAAIEADPKNPKRILTVRGVGYVFAKQQD